MITPSSKHFLHAATPIPLVISMPMPNTNPLDLYIKLIAHARPSFLLESGKGDETVARYSFIGCAPYMILSGKDTTYRLKTSRGISVHRGNPWVALADILRTSRIPKPEGVPPFFGGAIVCLSYDLVRSFEKLPCLADDDLHFPDVECLFVDQIAALDHHTHTLQFIFMPPLERFLSEPREKLYREGCDRLAEWAARASTPDLPQESPSLSSLNIRAGQSSDTYMDRVRRCLEYIRAGDIYQANLSHRFTVQSTSDSLHSSHLDTALYRRLKTVNPSPFSTLLNLERFGLIGCSPERLIRLRGQHADTRPIAGTRSRGVTVAEDRRLTEELLMNAKERAEHLMLVDLERNDLGRVCRYGTVQTNEFMSIERYSHVSHIVSNITGELRDGMDGFDLIQAVFPGGTITGVPKIRCMEIIESLEPVRRGPYTGSLGYISWSGDVDLNIIIRSLLTTDTYGYLQVGAGIVADSEPRREYDETLLKAGAIMQALGVSNVDLSQ